WPDVQPWARYHAAGVVAARVRLSGCPIGRMAHVDCPSTTSDLATASTARREALEIASTMRSGSIAIFAQQIGHYHAARYKAAESAFERLTVVSAMNAADFQEFLRHDIPGPSSVRLFDGRESYMAAVQSGRIRTAVHSALDSLKPSVVAVAGW